MMRVIKASTPLLRFPGGPVETEVRFGEPFDIVAAHMGYYSGHTVIDNYPGYIRKKDICPQDVVPRYRITAVSAPAYTQPDFKSPSRITLFMNSLVRVADGKHSFSETPEGTMVLLSDAGWVFEDQLSAIESFAQDYVAVALSCVGLPYEWGACTNRFDCSGLLQTALLACGIVAPRDSVPQSKVVGLPVDDHADFSELCRGDMVFWTQGKGRHVVIMTDEENCVHATIASPHRGVVVQPLREVIHDQLRDGNGSPTCVRRL